MCPDVENNGDAESVQTRIDLSDFDGFDTLARGETLDNGSL